MEEFEIQFKLYGNVKMQAKTKEEAIEEFLKLTKEELIQQLENGTDGNNIVTVFEE